MTHPSPKQVPLRKKPPPANPEKPKYSQQYDSLADTIGGVPNFKKRDNLFQLITTLITALIGLTVAYFGWGSEGILIGLFIGVVIGALGSGAILMVQGWRRALRARKNNQR